MNTKREQKAKENQLKLLKEIFDNLWPINPAFHPDHEGVPKDSVPYISVADLNERNYTIRVLPYDDFFLRGPEGFEKRANGEIIAHYESLEDLVEDGWMLD